MKDIITYNLNGIRSAANKGLWSWVAAQNPDILCVQELKAQPEDLNPGDWESMGYHATLHAAEKKGYSGVGIFSKQKPDHVVVGCGIAAYDREGRILRADFGDWSVLSCYFPSGTTGDIRQSLKMAFLADFSKWIDDLKKERPKLIITGDYNIAHKEIDIHDPKGNKQSSGFLPEERAWMDEWFASGFTDAFRAKNPEMVEYSWWSFRAGARKNNKGWRIDYQSVSNNIADKITDARQINAAMHSDHCPVWMRIAL
jgi:exodeoxyribonuclease III